MSHPSLGLSPRDLEAGHPAAAARLRNDRARLAGRALEIAAAADPTLPERLGELGLRNLLRDTEVLLDRLADAVAAGDPAWLGSFADAASTVFRRKRVAMADVIAVTEGLRSATRGVLTSHEAAAADAAIDAALEAFVEHRKLAGDAKPRNPIVSFLYKGA